MEGGWAGEGGLYLLVVCEYVSRSLEWEEEDILSLFALSSAGASTTASSTSTLSFELLQSSLSNLQAESLVFPILGPNTCCNLPVLSRRLPFCCVSYEAQLRGRQENEGHFAASPRDFRGGTKFSRVRVRFDGKKIKFKIENLKLISTKELSSNHIQE